MGSAHLELPSRRRDPMPIDGLRMTAISVLLARLFVSGGAVRYNESAKIKRNNVNRYACRRINKLPGNCTAS
jgi:hypothetical protein